METKDQRLSMREIEENVYCASDELASRYLCAAQEMGAEETIVVLPYVGEWGAKRV